ncbi:hypothetical protein Tco_0611597 [Tanacetum coccineum]
MKQDKAQQAVRDEKLVPSADRVKIGKSNLRMDPSVTQKEETYQVVLDIIKNTPCYNTFRISANEFTVPPSSDSLLEFLLDLGYKGQLRYISEILRSSRIRILWGIYHKANVDYDALNWEDLQYQIDNRQSKKTTATSKKKESKRKLVLHDESKKSKGEPENRPTGRKKRTPIDVVIQEPLSVYVKKTQKSSGKLKGAGLRPKVLNKLTGKSADSDEGVSTSPEVSDESKDKSKARDDLDDWGSTDDEEYLLAYKDKNPDDIPWQSTNDDEYENNDEKDDASIDIEKTNDERTDTDVEDQLKGVAEMNIVEEANEENTERVEEQKDNEELKADEEKKEDDQAGDEQVVVSVSTTHKEKPNLL